MNLIMSVKKLNIKETDFVCGTIAPFKPQKGLFHLIEIAEKVLKSGKNKKNVVFMITGDGDLREALQTKLKEKGIIDTGVAALHGTKNPDECFVDEENKRIVIIEKKFQQCGGSVCEKLQTCLFKKENYEERFPDYDVEYVYCLSDWLR